MRKLFSMIAAVLFAGSMFAAVQEFTMTISPSDFNSTSYAANNNEKTTIAVATADPSVRKLMVKSLTQLLGEKLRALLLTTMKMAIPTSSVAKQNRLLL